MKLVMMMYAGPNPQRIAAVLDEHEVHAFTEIDRAHGRGSTGRIEGTRAWPGETSVLFTVVPDERVVDLQQAFRTLATGVDAGERLHVVVLPVESFF